MDHDSSPNGNSAADSMPENQAVIQASEAPTSVAAITEASRPYDISDPCLAARLPPLPKLNYEQLKKNILSEGRVRNPLVVWRQTNKLLDGYHRDRAYYELLSEGHQLEPLTIEYMDFSGIGSAVGWMLANQEGSRPQFTTYQKVKAIYQDETLWLALKKEAESRMHHKEGSTSLNEAPADVRQAIADMVSVSRGTVDSCLTVLQNPDFDDLKASVEAGTVAASKAATIIKTAKKNKRVKVEKSKDDLENDVLNILADPAMARRVEKGEFTAGQAADAVDKRHKKVVDTIKANLAVKVLPDFFPNGWLNAIHNCDALEGMKKLPDNSIDLTFTSPPYPLKFKFYRHWDYEAMFGGDYPKYLAWIEEHFKEIYRVTGDGKRFVVNIDNCYDSKPTTSGGPRLRLNCYADFCEIANRVGFHFEGDYCWYKQNCVSNRVLMGSKAFARGQRNYEYLLVFYKGTPDTTVNDALYDLTPKQRAKYSISGWHIKPVTPVKKHGKGTAPFPFKLPCKVVKLHSVRTQIVMDPFSGSGTTCAAAAYLGRQFVGFEKDEALVKTSIKRVAKAIEKAKAKAAAPIDAAKVIEEASFKSGSKLFVTDGNFISMPTASVTLSTEVVDALVNSVEKERTGTNS